MKFTWINLLGICKVFAQDLGPTHKDNWFSKCTLHPPSSLLFNFTIIHDTFECLTATIIWNMSWIKRRGYKAAERRSSLQSKHRGRRMKTISRIIHATTVACNQRMPFLLSGRMNESAANSDPWYPPWVGWRKLSRTIPLQLLSLDWLPNSTAFNWHKSESTKFLYYPRLILQIISGEGQNR